MLIFYTYIDLFQILIFKTHHWMSQ